MLNPREKHGPHGSLVVQLEDPLDTELGFFFTSKHSSFNHSRLAVDTRKLIVFEIAHRVILLVVA
jgi:hypothetical protein